MTTSDADVSKPEEASQPEEPAAGAPEAEVYSDDEAEVIAERLAALGYIE